ncbi:MAG: mechanosensitive ion channel family protein [Candidatus Caldarchaeum sp.]|nr:mechanosensitive ion channel family protein [Candidatus Caldarchaeum sp.]MCS7137860.1 mechanosensitive ion channel family protein [Candidatus Caldarchaeum sp.]MDW7978816.1 mechanosensitive ion channel family protein [Candidatus Caldarchaeum sp.]MDW8359360.1 mechanosensitive ion channel family protein [Candidatus Caldarchaeum sp.]
MQRIRLSILTVVALAAGLYLTAYALTQMGLLPANTDRVIYVLIGVSAGVFIVRLLSSYIVRTFKPLVGQQAVGVSLTIQLVGYAAIAVFLLSSIGVPPETALAGGTLTGLVIGLAGQTTISNIIAGIIILVSRPFKIGDRVGVITSLIPYQWAFLPGYKFFSRDYVVPAYTGVVENMSLMYTTLVTDDGLVMKIPNNLILANSAIANYSEVSERVRKLRYEFPVEFSPEEVLEKVRERLNGFSEVKQVYLEEQSDKTHYIIAVVFDAPIDTWREVKSRILMNVIEVHRGLKALAQNTLKEA